MDMLLWNIICLASPIGKWIEGYGAEAKVEIDAIYARNIS